MASRAGEVVKKQLGPLRRYLQSDKGQNLINAVGIFGAAFAGGSYVMAHTWFAGKYQEIIQHYKHGFPTKVSQEMEARTEQVLKDMSFKERYRRAVSTFHVFGFEPFIIGSFKTADGVRLGIPKYLEYKESGDIERSDIQIEQQPVKWHTEEGQSFAQSLLLSDSAKKFLIGQQLSMADSYFVYVHAFLIAGSIIGYRTLTFYLNRKTYGFRRPTSYRVALYSLCAAFWYGLWSASTDIYNKHLEREGDERAGGLNLEYAKGGVEYYSKLLQRNMALRELMGPSGEKMYTPLGNYQQFLRQRYIPVTSRKESLEKIVERHMGSSQDSNK